MPYKFIHKRGHRAIGNFVPTGIRHARYNPVVDGSGVFLMPDDTPEDTLKFIQKNGHKLAGVIKNETPAKETPKETPYPSGPPKKVNDDWTKPLSQIKGCGKKTCEFLAKEFSGPKELLDYDDSTGPAGNISPRTWLRIKDKLQ